MEIKPGYKQTEVGIIPEDWNVLKIGEFCKCFSGGTPLTSKSEYYGGSISWITSSDLNKQKIYDVTGRITQVGLENSSAKLVNKGTLLLALYGATAGVSAITEIDAAINQAILAITPSGFSSKFLYQYLQLRKDFYINTYTQGGQPNFSGDIVKSFIISLPPTLAEQELIAEALSDVDGLIEGLQRLIDKKKLIKQGAMQALLTGRKRLPGFDKGQGYKQTEVGVIPEDWDLVSMAEVGDALIGLTYSPMDVCDHGTLVLRSSNIQQGKLTFDDNVFVNTKLPERVVTQEGDILICVRNGSRQLIGKCALIDKKSSGSAFGAFMSVYRSRFSKFILYQFQSSLIQSQIKERMGATINQITNKDLSEFKIYLPRDVKEQKAIATTLSEMDMAIEALEQKLGKYRQIKQGMMQELLTGKTRLVGPSQGA